MENEIPSIISHVSLGTNDFERAKDFYDSVLAALDCRCLEHFPGAAAYGKTFPEFWIQSPIDGNRATSGNGVHVGFIAASQDAVHAFYEAAIAAGATGEGEPGPRPDYGDPYYGCFVRDLDGNKIEAAFWDMNASIEER